jgi:TRAP-type mannitol/chloroaromatic compound transport system permease small subunit
MLISKKRIVIATALALYLYFLLPATATMFYELYHFTEIGPIYWGYSAFKAAGYYFGVWPYQVHACIAVGLAVVVLPALWQRLRSH